MTAPARSAPPPPPPVASGFLLTLDDLLSGWLVPGVALAAVAGAYGLYAAGFVTEATVAAAAAVAAAVAAAAYLVRPALAPRADALGRGLAIAVAVGTAALVVFGPLQAVRPGRPIFEGDLSEVGDRVPVPADASGTVRLLVHTTLSQRGTPDVSFRIAGPTPPAEGHLQRTVSYARVGRGARAAVTHDHTDLYVEADLPPGAGALTLERTSGERAGPFHVAAYRDPLPFGWALALSIVLVVLAAVADARLATRQALAPVAGMALLFAILVAENATPVSALGPVMGGVFLGAFGGAIAGEVAKFAARRLVPAPAARAQRTNGR